MGNRDFAVVALGRFLAVERYRETHLSPSTNQLHGPGPDRVGGHTGKQDSTSGSRAPARAEHG